MTLYAFKGYSDVPTGAEITTDDTRVLGRPVGFPGYCRSFAENAVKEVIEDLGALSSQSFRRATASWLACLKFQLAGL